MAFMYMHMYMHMMETFIYQYVYVTHIRQLKKHESVIKDD